MFARIRTTVQPFRKHLLRLVAEGHLSMATVYHAGRVALVVARGENLFVISAGFKSHKAANHYARRKYLRSPRQVTIKAPAAVA